MSEELQNVTQETETPVEAVEEAVAAAPAAEEAPTVEEGMVEGQAAEENPAANEPSAEVPVEEEMCIRDRLKSAAAESRG